MSSSHRFRFLRENWYRDVWLVIISSAVLWASVSTYQNQVNQRVGRRVAVGATCAALSGVIEAGRATISSGVIIKPQRFERNLEKLGLPPIRIRKHSAEDAAFAYGRAIAIRVAQATHNKSLVRSDGTLDCHLLQVAARTRSK
jgi:hypothetical protein